MTEESTDARLSEEQAVEKATLVAEAEAPARAVQAQARAPEAHALQAAAATASERAALAAPAAEQEGARRRDLNEAAEARRTDGAGCRARCPRHSG